MSTPEQPSVQGLTRKQLREIRMTGATPIISADADDPAEAGEQAPESETPDTPIDADGPHEDAHETTEDDAAPPAPLPRAAEPVPTAVPRPDSQVDLGVAPLTRRQAREQERIRTASVPVITPDAASAHAAAQEATPAEAPEAEEELVADDTAADDSLDALFTADPAPDEEDEATDEQVAEHSSEEVDETTDEEPAAHEPDDADAPPSDEAAPEAAEATASADEPAAPGEEESPAPVVGAAFGLGVAKEPASAPASFDDLIVRNSTATGSMATSNALILSQVPESPSLVGPVAATGEMLITGSLNFEGVGSRGHSPGAADGHEVDAVLVDGELPAHSSPTPIAAASAVSTQKVAGEMIRPPEPEKNSKLMLILAISAGVLAIALVGVLIVAFVTGVFS